MKKYDNKKTYVLSGQSLNQIADGINFVNEVRQKDSAASMRPYRTGEIRVCNPSGENAKTIPAYSCVVLTGLRENSVTSSVFTFLCKLPEQTDADSHLFAITTEPIHPGSAGHAVLDGIAVVRNLQNLNDSYNFLRPVFDGSGDLEYAAHGNIRRLGEIRIDEQTSRYLVQIGSAGSGSASIIPARVKSGSAETGYTVDLYERGKDNGITTSDVTVFLPYAMYGAAIPADSWIMVTQSQTIVIPDEEDGV